MDFQSVEQRIAYGFLDTLPEFVPAQEGPPPAEQRIFYDMIRGLYQLALDEPALFVPKLHGDDAPPNRFNKASYGKQDLLVHMKKMRQAIEGVVEALWGLARDPAAVRLNRRQREILARLGIRGEADVTPAWRWMATRPEAGIGGFARCMLRPGYPYMSKVYARLLGDEEAFRKLEQWMLDHGYQIFCIENTVASDDTLTVTYANMDWDPKPPKGGFEYGIRHTGVAMRYDGNVAVPPVLGLCIPGGLKQSLLALGEMDGALQDFIVERAKKCDGCRYCVQTDKTGKRPLACIPVAQDGKRIALCPYFPGYSFCWSTLTDELADRLIAFLAFLDDRMPVRAGGRK